MAFNFVLLPNGEVLIAGRNNTHPDIGRCILIFSHLPSWYEPDNEHD